MNTVERSRPSAARGAAIAMIMSLLTAGHALAHEIGTTRVSLAIDPDRYRLEIVTDAAALLDKLTASAETIDEERTAPTPLRQRLEAMSDVFRQRVEIVIDDERIRPDIVWTVSGDSATGPRASIELTGTIPPNAHHLTWTYSWTFTSYPFTVHQNGGVVSTTEWLGRGQTSAAVRLDANARRPESWLHAVRRYLILGFTHILPNGLDHMLFVLGVFLLHRRIRPILVHVSAFTIAHSLTLALSLSGTVALHSRIVEPLIAISIVYVAIENVLVPEAKWWRVLIVFAFGLIHGLGFAGALQDVGLPHDQLVPALVGFNAGVELGQFAVVGMAFLLVGRPYAAQAWYRRRIVVPASAAIAWVAVYWTLERIAALN